MPGGILVLLPIGNRSIRKNKAGRQNPRCGMEALWAGAGIMRRQPWKTLGEHCKQKSSDWKAQWRKSLAGSSDRGEWGWGSANKGYTAEAQQAGASCSLHLTVKSTHHYSKDTITVLHENLANFHLEKHISVNSQFRNELLNYGCYDNYSFREWGFISMS